MVTVESKRVKQQRRNEMPECSSGRVLVDSIILPLVYIITDYFSLRFSGHFPGEPGLAGVY